MTDHDDAESARFNEPRTDDEIISDTEDDWYDIDSHPGSGCGCLFCLDLFP